MSSWLCIFEQCGALTFSSLPFDAPILSNACLCEQVCSHPSSNLFFFKKKKKKKTQQENCEAVAHGFEFGLEFSPLIDQEILGSPEICDQAAAGRNPWCMKCNRCWPSAKEEDSWTTSENFTNCRWFSRLLWE